MSPAYQVKDALQRRLGGVLHVRVEQFAFDGAFAAFFEGGQVFVPEVSRLPVHFELLQALHRAFKPEAGRLVGVLLLANSHRVIGDSAGTVVGVDSRDFHPGFLVGSGFGAANGERRADVASALRIDSTRDSAENRRSVRCTEIEGFAKILSSCAKQVGYTRTSHIKTNLVTWRVCLLICGRTACVFRGVTLLWSDNQ